MYKILFFNSVLQFSEIIILAPFFIALPINLLQSNSGPYIAKKIFPDINLLLTAENPEKEYLNDVWYILIK